jgi:hypothetical protein
LDPLPVSQGYWQCWRNSTLERSQAQPGLRNGLTVIAIVSSQLPFPSPSFPCTSASTVLAVAKLWCGYPRFSFPQGSCL